MKYLNRITSILIWMFCIIAYSCLDDKDQTLVLATTEYQSGTNTVTGTSNSYTQLSQSGFILTVPIQAISETTGGNEGKLVFSLEATDDLPRPLPSCLTQIGYVAKVEPFNFIFKYPVTLTLPIGSNTNIEKISVYKFNEFTNEWDKIPISGFGNKTVIVSVLSLGYFVAVTDNCTDTNTLGGLRFIHPENSKKYFYTLTLYAYEGGGNGYVLNGSHAYTMPLGNGSPDLATYIPYIPKGYYGVYVTREERSTISSEPISIQHYSYVSYAEIETTLNRSGNAINNWNGYSGWTDLILNSNGRWIEGRPVIWGNPTVTYGTGKFQATLTWVNASSSATDYDLHLYGPDVHVYYSNKSQGCFELDRDWVSEIGNAIENLYSIRDEFPAGEYTVKVHLYGGRTGKEFNCRVLYNGEIVRSIRSSISSSKTYEDIYTFTVQ
jgi:hypothetical protein